MTLRRTTLLLAGGLCLLTLLGCEVRTSVKLGSGPSFSFDGSGRLASFSVYGPRTGHKIATPSDSKSLVWSVQASNGYPDIPVAGMNLVYGTAPNGYAQIVPSRGTAPALATGLVYYFFAETTGAPGKGGFFYMDKAAPILIRVPDLCGSGFTGDVKPVKCGANEPYVEPKDLGQFIRENRLKQ
jgi:hypothetical protein